MASVCSPDVAGAIARVRARVDAEESWTDRILREGVARRRATYWAYIRSPEWAAKRSARLALDGETCQARLDGCQAIATEVHHLTYDHIGNEPMWDLVSVCRACHQQISEMDGRA